MDWLKYYDTVSSQSEEESENIPEQQNYKDVKTEEVDEDNPITLSQEDLNDFISRLSGKDPFTGQGKTTICYQSYDNDSPDDDPNKSRVFQITNATVQIARNKKYNDLYTIDFIFQSPDDAELKLFWARLQQYLKNQSKESHKDWIFFINLVEKASVSLQTVEQDTVLTGNIINPILFYLTREIPNMTVHDSNVNGEMLGGNIVRMIVSSGNLIFNLETDIDTSTIKGEIQREEEDSRYLDNYYQQQKGEF